MFSVVNSAAIRGVSIVPVKVETDMSEGMPVLDMVGLLSSEVKEARERVKTAIKNTGIHIPPKRITINLSPAELRKEGGFFDLPIAVGILMAMGNIVSAINIEETLFVGELGLDGNMKSIRGALAIAISSREFGFKRIVLPKENAKEAAYEKKIEVIGVSSLRDVINILNGKIEKENMVNKCDENIEEDYLFYKNQDFSEINGQEGLKRASLIAASGRHNILFIGPPGSGKTMVAERIPTILPPPTYEECLEITKIHSIAGRLEGKSIINKRPFERPHHTVTTVALMGGGVNIKPGELSLAHKGVLFLDELTEFRRETLDALRQPLEEKRVMINRAYGKYQFPADIMLVAATNPCKCGYYPDRNKCYCTENEVKRYFGKISGPFMNRIDITVGATFMKVEDMQKERVNVSSEELRKKVEAATMIQAERYKGTDIGFNSKLSAKDIKKYCYLGEAEKKLLRNAFEKIGVSARTYYKTIKVARTIADVEGSVNIKESHIAEALGYRPTAI